MKDNNEKREKEKIKSHPDKREASAEGRQRSEVRAGSRMETARDSEGGRGGAWGHVKGARGPAAAGAANKASRPPPPSIIHGQVL